MADFDIASSEPINFLDSTTEFATQEYDSIPSSDPIKFGTETETKLDLVLVIQPGSANLRIGRVTDTQPEIIPHVIAYRQNENCIQYKSVDETLLFNLESENINTYSEIRKQHLGEISSFLQDVRPKGNVTLHPKRLRDKNETIQQQELTEQSEITSTTLTPPYRLYIGEDALHIPLQTPYSIHWPIKRGKFNITPTQSIEMVLQCLEDIWRSSVIELCGSYCSFGDYKVLLLIQDIFDRQEVKHMVDILLTRLKFGSVAVQQSSVCAVYSSGTSSSCVVDVGDQVISISCVEDGISNPNTRLSLSYGGNDITRAFWWLINQSGFPYKDWDISDRIDRSLMGELKEDICHLDMELTGIREFPFRVNPPDSNAVQFRIFLCDEPILAPLTFFCPGFITMVTNDNVKSQKVQQPHPEDYLDDVTLLETKKELVSGIERNCEQEAEQPIISKLITSKSIGGIFSNSKLLSLDQAVHLSISCSNEQNKQKLYKSIIVTGAGFQFPKGLSFLQNRLKETLPENLKKLQIEIFTPPRGDISMLSWSGGTIVASLDTFSEVWIKREEWLTSGVRLIRERSPFIW